MTFDNARQRTLQSSDERINFLPRMPRNNHISIMIQQNSFRAKYRGCSLRSQLDRGPVPNVGATRVALEIPEATLCYRHTGVDVRRDYLPTSKKLTGPKKSIVIGCMLNPALQGFRCLIGKIFTSAAETMMWPYLE